MSKEFSLNVPRLVLHLHDELMYEVSKIKKLNYICLKCPAGTSIAGTFMAADPFMLTPYYYFLNLKTVFIFQVPSENLDQFCHILKGGMENAICLSVKLPVKVKVGKTWGTLELKTFTS